MRSRITLPTGFWEESNLYGLAGEVESNLILFWTYTAHESLIGMGGSECLVVIFEQI